MSYRHGFVVRTVLYSIRTELRKALWTETGGPLVGYESEDGALVVTDAGGPGSCAELRPWSVTVDGQFSKAFCDRVYKETGGLLDYIGDWHCHWGWWMKPSTCDVLAMEGVKNSGACAARYPVSLIYGRFTRRFVTHILISEGELRQIPCSIIESIPGIFLK